MLPHYSALKVAGSFRMLETLFPGRIDLGVGRALGTDGRTAAALTVGPGALSIEQYPEQLALLARFLRDEVPDEPPLQPIRAMPAGDSAPELWVLGSSMHGAEYAAELGLPFTFAHFINPEWAFEATEHYRSLFRPSSWLTEPRINLGVWALCAESEEEARRLIMSRYLWRLRNQRGVRGGVPSPETALAVEYTEAEREYIEFQGARDVVGDPQQVRARLLELGEQLRIDEFIIVTITYDFAARLRSYELIAKEFGVTRQRSGPSHNGTSA